MGRVASNILDLRDTEDEGFGEKETEEEEAEAAGTHDVGDNSILADMIKTACTDMEVIDTERDALNARANEIRARLENAGVNKVAFNAAYRRKKQGEEKRKAHDFSYSLCCKALDVGYQADLWT